MAGGDAGTITIGIDLLIKNYVGKMNQVIGQSLSLHKKLNTLTTGVSKLEQAITKTGKSSTGLGGAWFRLGVLGVTLQRTFKPLTQMFSDIYFSGVKDVIMLNMISSAGPLLNPVIDMIWNLVNAFLAWDSPLKSVITFIGILLGFLGGLLATVGFLGHGLQGLIILSGGHTAATKMQTAAVLQLVAALNAQTVAMGGVATATAAATATTATASTGIAAFANPVGIAILAIAALVVYFTWLFGPSGRALVGGWGESTGKKIREWGASTGKAFFNVGLSMKKIKYTADETWRGMWENITEFAKNIWTDISDWAVNLYNTVTGIWEDIKTKAGEIWEGIKNKISEKFGPIVDWIKDKINWVKEHFGSWEAIKTTVSNIWESVKNSIAEKMDAIKTKISDIWDTIKTSITGKIDEIKTLISDTWDIIETKTTEKWDSIKTAISSPFESAYNFIKGKLDEFKNLIDRLPDPIKKLLGISTTITVADGGGGGGGVTFQEKGLAATLGDWQRSLSGMGKIEGGRSIFNLEKSGAISKSMYLALTSWWEGLYGFQKGGLVPGPIGAPMPAIVHGGETVVPRGKSMSYVSFSPNVTINAEISSDLDIKEIGNQLLDQWNMELGRLV